MYPQLVVLHIPKTAGTSLRRSVLEPNISCRPLRGTRLGDLRTFRSSDDVDCLHGHIGYGYHRIVRRPIVYSTQLREPVDRALSYYYFIRDLERTDLVERHALRDYADSVTVGQFFLNPKFSNLTTRRLAGFEFDHAYPSMHRAKPFRRAMVAAAMRHLNAMPVFGLQHHFEELQRRFLRYLGAEQIKDVPREKKTKKRPSRQEIADDHPRIIEQLTTAHDLDLELFQFACDLFDRQS